MICEYMILFFGGLNMGSISIELAIVFCIICLIFGFLISFLIFSSRVSSYKKENEIQKNGIRNLKEENDSLEKENRALTGKLTELAANESAIKQSYRNLEEWISKADYYMKDSFVVLSKNITENNNKTFLENTNDKLNDFTLKLNENLTGNNHVVNGIISPVAKELDDLRKKVEEIEKQRIEAYSGLTAQVQTLEKQNQDLFAATTLLNNTLNNNSQRGKWGEEQLHKIAELSGMVEHIDFEEQSVNLDKTRPDMVIHLTGDRTVPVDSKAPMNAYMLYLSDTNENEKKKHQQEHVKALKNHIDVLNQKAYWKSENRSVEFVAMVIPYESGLSVAFEADQEILTYAMDRNVILLSPMTFYAFLKSVSIGWKENTLSKNAKDIAKLSKELIDRFNVFYGYFDNIDKALSDARNEYDKAVSSYNRRLLPTFTKLKNLNEGQENSLIEE